MTKIPLAIQNKIETARNQKLKELDLSYKVTLFKLKKIPSSIFDLTDLEILNLRNNEISEIPREILQLKQLKYLNLIDNEFKKIPEILSQLKSLKSLSITYKAK